MLTDKNEKQLFYGDVHPNVQYEYDTNEPGEYKLCVQLTEMAFSNKNQKIKTKVKFSAEFHRSKLESPSLISWLFTDQRARKEKERGIFDVGEESLVDGKESSGNFHMKSKQHEEYESAVTEGHFNVLHKRINKIDTSLDEIIQYQVYEREQELNYRHYQNSLYNNLFNLTVLEILMVLGSAGYSVFALRKFFVKKSIFWALKEISSNLKEICVTSFSF